MFKQIFALATSFNLYWESTDLRHCLCVYESPPCACALACAYAYAYYIIKREKHFQELVLKRKNDIYWNHSKIPNENIKKVRSPESTPYTTWKCKMLHSLSIIFSATSLAFSFHYPVVDGDASFEKFYLIRNDVDIFVLCVYVCVWLWYRWHDR